MKIISLFLQKRQDSYSKNILWCCHFLHSSYICAFYSFLFLIILNLSMLSALVSQISVDHSVTAFFPSYRHSRFRCIADFKQRFGSELNQALQKVSLTGEERSENHTQLIVWFRYSFSQAYCSFTACQNPTEYISQDIIQYSHSFQ